jgi:uncharacterized membrane protein YhaH (DUF805 family)
MADLWNRRPYSWWLAATAGLLFVGAAAGLVAFIVLTVIGASLALATVAWIVVGVMVTAKMFHATDQRGELS